MRRNAVAATGALALALLSAGAGFADPKPAAAAPAHGKVLCQNSDANLSNATGLVATASGYVVVRTGSQTIYVLDGKCKRKSTLHYPSTANSPQDVSVTSDGTLWVADTGEDAANPRPRIALWKIPAGGGRGTLYRFTYPGGAHYDARAMVMSGNGTPVFITKVGNGPAGLYAPSGALNANGNAVPLKKVGEFTPQRTNTSNPLGSLGSLTVTGGATSPDGTKVVLRTYSDAYEWGVTGGDVVAAITGGKPQVTAMPDETAGEAVAFSRDGQFLLTTSNTTVDADHPLAILQYTPAVAGTTTQANSGAGTTGGPAGAAKADTRNWWNKLTLEQIAYLVAAVGVIGLLMVVGGIIGIRRARSQQKQALPLGDGSARGAGSASVPGLEPPERGYDPYGQEQAYEPYGNQYGTQHADGYPPQEYRSGYGNDYDQPGPAARPPQGGTYGGGAYGGGTHVGGTYQGGGGYQDSYGGPAGDGYRRVGDGQGARRAAPPPPPSGYDFPEGPGVYGGSGR